MNFLVRLMAVFSLCFCLSGIHAASATASGGDSGSRLLWTLDLGAPAWGSPAFDGARLYTGTDAGTLLAIDLVSHTIVWQFKTAGPVRSRPAFAGDMLIFNSDDGFVRALDRTTGRLVWRTRIQQHAVERHLPTYGEPYYDYQQSSPAIAADTVFIGSADGSLHALNVKNGHEQWHYSTDAPVRTTPVVEKGRVFFGGWDHRIHALDAATGESIWTFDTGKIVQSTVAIVEGRVIVGSRSAHLYALDEATGKLLWSHEYRSGSWVESSAVPGNGRIYLGSSDDRKLSAFDPRTGEEVWKFNTGGWSWATPAVADGVVYEGAISSSPYYVKGVTLQRGLFAVNADNGTLRWRFTPPTVPGYITGGFMATPVVTGDAVYAPGLDGRLYALKR
ncbi:MAG: PQQ-binding-like beta-propeller repeat protein [Gammaproteobacteria bacterium]|jgi:outer membrane protein assembly factor BamB